jgi:hypothetical protein
MVNAVEALTLWVDVAAEHGQPIPTARSLVDLKRDPEISRELSQFMVALIPLRPQLDAAQ